MSRAGIPKSWPVLEEIGPLTISRNRVLGELASWAVQQSPYPVPEKLEIALSSFNSLWPRGEYAQFESPTDLRFVVLSTMHMVEEIIAWNQRKNGRDGPAFVSRYSEPHPDNDFIDLDALARNIAMECWHAAADEKAFNDDFDKRHNKSALPQTD